MALEARSWMIFHLSGAEPGRDADFRTRPRPSNLTSPHKSASKTQNTVSISTLIARVRPNLHLINLLFGLERSP